MYNAKILVVTPSDKDEEEMYTVTLKMPLVNERCTALNG
jgi:hypothetical protein